MGRSFEVRKASMAKTAGAKIKVYSKYGKEIYMCAKNGGGDPDMNLSLKHLIAKAKKKTKFLRTLSIKRSTKRTVAVVKTTLQHVTKASVLAVLALSLTV